MLHEYVNHDSHPTRLVLVSIISTTLLIVSLSVNITTTNSSICTDIYLNQLYYYINTANNAADITQTSNSTATLTYNLCKSVSIFCTYSQKVLTDSMIIVDTAAKSCDQCSQNYIALINQTNPKSGIYVNYNCTSGKVLKNYSCNATYDIGCPLVYQSVVWSYFDRNQIIYTIAIEIIGFILMVLGVYIYRGSIVLVGWATAFSILVGIESLFVFRNGVPDEVIKNALILTVVCSFLVGYILGYFPKAGLFCMGLWLGVILSLTLNNIAFYHINTNPDNLVLYIVLPILSVGFGVMIIFIKRTFIIFSSSLIGSYMCLRALSFYLGAFPNELLLAKQYHLGLVGPITWQFYLYVIALFVLTASSSALQYWLFKQKAKKTNESADIDQQFNEMEDRLKKERNQLVEFKDVFKSERGGPRVLRKSNRSNVSMDYQEELQPYRDSDQSSSKNESKQISKKAIKKVIESDESEDDTFQPVRPAAKLNPARKDLQESSGQDQSTLKQQLLPSRFKR